MLSELHTTALLGKALCGRADALPALEVLRMATLNGAEARGLNKLTGSLVEGKAADLIAVDLSALETQPLFDPCSQVVYAASRGQVTDVWGAGQHVLRERQLTTLDETDIKQRALTWQQRLNTGTS